MFGFLAGLLADASSCPLRNFIVTECAHVNIIYALQIHWMHIRRRFVQCFCWPIDLEKFFCIIGCMSQPKEKIPIEKLRELAKVLAFLHETTEKAVADFTAADFDSTDVEGWRTLHRGLVYAHRIVKKIAGPASPVQKLDLDVLLLPHHKSKKAKRSAEKKADLEKMDEAEAKLKASRKSKPPSQ